MTKSKVAKAPRKVLDLYFRTRCEHCGWVGSSEFCAIDYNFAGDESPICPKCEKYFICEPIEE